MEFSTEVVLYAVAATKVLPSFSPMAGDVHNLVRHVTGSSQGSDDPASTHFLVNCAVAGYASIWQYPALGRVYFLANPDGRGELPGLKAVYRGWLAVEFRRLQLPAVLSIQKPSQAQLGKFERMARPIIARRAQVTNLL